MALVPKYERINAKEVTFVIDNSTITFDQTQKNGSAQVGKVVALTAVAKTIGLVQTNGEILGRLEKVEPDGAATVNVRGGMDLPTDGTAITIGGGLIGGATAGTVKTGTSQICKALDTPATGKVTAYLR